MATVYIPTLKETPVDAELFSLKLPYLVEISSLGNSNKVEEIAEEIYRSNWIIN